VDGVLLVVDAHNSHRGALAQAREQLEQSGANVMGAVMNNFDATKAKKYGNRYDGRYYPYGYRYGYAYGRYGYGGDAADVGNGAAALGQAPLTREPGSR
jgi:Mrp family chromosome partitioning ATPase